MDNSISDDLPSAPAKPNPNQNQNRLQSRPTHESLSNPDFTDSGVVSAAVLEDTWTESASGLQGQTWRELKVGCSRNWVKVPSVTGGR